jgi:hypothetical protein
MGQVDWPPPWPIQEVVRALGAGDVLANLTRSRQAGPTRDVREDRLESLLRDVLSLRFGPERVWTRKALKTVIPSVGSGFPGATQPDFIVRHEGLFYICEAKSSRTDYPRFDCVFDSKAFRAHLTSQGHSGPDPYEVEQDLIKLLVYRDRLPEVGGCLFLMVDAFAGVESSWTSVFRNAEKFRSTMRTEIVRVHAEEVVRTTRVLELDGAGAKARLFVCPVGGDAA